MILKSIRLRFNSPKIIYDKNPAIIANKKPLIKPTIISFPVDLNAFDHVNCFIKLHVLP